MKKYDSSDIVKLRLGDKVTWKLDSYRDAARLRRIMCHHKYNTGLQYRTHWNEELRELTIIVLEYEENF